VQVIFRQTPTLDSTKHYGSRIVFGPDQTLFLTLGERSILEGRVQSQDLGSHLGKVVRIYRDGSVPEDDPLVDREDARPSAASGASTSPASRSTASAWSGKSGS
jgi:aldose sugar dehydrogenase